MGEGFGSPAGNDKQRYQAQRDQLQRGNQRLRERDQWEKALDLLQEMTSNGIKPNVISYNTAISACEKGNQWEKALDLLQEMTSNGIKPDVISYNAAISACEKGSQWEKAACEKGNQGRRLWVSFRK